MSFLKTLYILFKNAGTEDVKKGQDEVERATKKTAAALDKTDKGLIHVQKEFSKFGKELLGFASISAAVFGTFKGIKSAIDYAGQLAIVSQNLKVNVEELDAWGNAVRRTGGSAESFQQSLKGLSERLYTSGENALKVLPQLADAFQKMGRTAAMRYGQTLGLDEATIMLLQKGRRELDSLIDRQRQLGVVTKHDAEIAREYNYAWQDTTHQFRSMFMAVGEEVLPFLIKVVRILGDVAGYFTKHADLIIGGLIAIGAAAVIAAAPFIIANAGIIALTAGIAGAIALFALIFEDIKYFLEGNKSLIGDILEKWPKVGVVIKTVFDDIKKSIDLMIAAYERVKDLFLSGKKVEIGTSFEVNNKPLKWGENPVEKSFLSPLELEAVNSTAVPTSFNAGEIKDTIDSTMPIEKSDRQQILETQSALRKTLSTWANSPLTSQTSNSLTNSQFYNSLLNKNSTNKNVTLNTGAITIETQATAPVDIASEFTKSLYEHLRQTTNTFDDGVRI